MKIVLPLSGPAFALPLNHGLVSASTAHAVNPLAVFPLPNVCVFFGIRMPFWALVLCGMMRAHASAPSPFGNHVGTILSASSKPEVVGVNAEPVVSAGAVMEDAESVRYVPKENSPRGAVGTSGWVPEFPIPIGSDGPGPQPAFIAGIEILKEGSSIHGDYHTKQSGVEQ